MPDFLLRSTLLLSVGAILLLGQTCNLGGKFVKAGRKNNWRYRVSWHLFKLRHGVLKSPLP